MSLTDLVEAELLLSAHAVPIHSSLLLLLLFALLILQLSNALASISMMPEAVRVTTAIATTEISPRSERSTSPLTPNATAASPTLFLSLASAA